MIFQDQGNTVFRAVFMVNTVVLTFKSSSANVIKNDVFDESLNANYYELYFEL